MNNYFKNKVFFITGGTGSFGKALTKVLLENYKPKKIVIFSRDELKQYEMKNQISLKYINKMRFFIGDIRDLPRLKTAMQNVDFVIHAAALKHVPIAEYNPFEFIKTNVIGSQNVIDAATDVGVSRVIALSTDKAASPINLYGATKLTADKLFIAANNTIGNRKIAFSVVRYGNVLNSRGSVLPLFLDQLKKDYFTITDKNMTRFIITLNQGVDFVLNSLKNMGGGEIFIPKIPSIKIIDLAKSLDKNKKIIITGIRPGEKIHEEMITISDSLNTVEFKEFYIIFPNSEFLTNQKKMFFKNFVKKNNGLKVMNNFRYSSDNNLVFLSISGIQKLINSNEVN
jgi:UDP-N-acetylglucosamine 4,6-dehydratase